jgi:hypothetical protein
MNRTVQKILRFVKMSQQREPIPDPPSKKIKTPVVLYESSR